MMYGEVAEWSMVLDWKSCVGKLTEGSNPSLSAISWIHDGFSAYRGHIASWAPHRTLL